MMNHDQHSDEIPASALVCWGMLSLPFFLDRLVP